MSPVRTLLLLRHATAEPDRGGGDHGRPLSAQGRRDAAAVGARLAERDLVPDLVLSSDAARARQTSDLVRAALPRPVAARIEPRLYAASAAALVAVVAETGDDVRALLVVGHEPALSASATALAGPGSEPGLVTAVRAHLPTAGVAVLELDGRWDDVEAGACRLAALESPQR